jgi:hypothetical protein
VSNVIIPRFLNTQRNQEGKEEEEEKDEDVFVRADVPIAMFWM